MSELGVSSDILLRTLQTAPKLAYETTQIHLTPSAQRPLENARAEASRLNDEFFGASTCSSPPSWGPRALLQEWSGPTILNASACTSP